jgi:hypothetical protein
VNNSSNHHEIIIFKSASVDIFNKAYTFIRNKYPQARITAIIQKSKQYELEPFDIDQVICIKDGFFNYFRDAQLTRGRIVGNYDMIVFLFNNSGYHGYNHLLFFGNTLKEIKYKYAFFPDGSLHPLPFIFSYIFTSFYKMCWGRISCCLISCIIWGWEKAGYKNRD